MQSFALKNGYSEDLQHALGSVSHSSAARGTAASQSGIRPGEYASHVPINTVYAHPEYTTESSIELTITKDFVRGAWFGAIGVIALLLLVILIVRISQKQQQAPPVPYIIPYPYTRPP